MDTRFRAGVTLHADGLARTFARARVGLRALAAHRQAAQVTDAAIALDALQTLQVHTDLAAQVALDHVFAVLDGMDDLGKLGLRQVFGADLGINVGAGKNVFRIAGTDAVNVAQRDVDTLVRRDFYSDDTSHVLVDG
jgi:hypothetical protein